MNGKRIVFALVVLALTIGCAWGATGISATGGFAVVPDKEAVQIIGGDGKTCTHMIQEYHWFWCDGTYMDIPPASPDCDGGYLSVYPERWECEDAPSGECDDSNLMDGLYFCQCHWYAESQTCEVDGEWQRWVVYACQ
jgi:hypothetical protein